LWDIVAKYCTARQAKDDSAARMRFECRVTKERLQTKVHKV